MLSSSDDSEDEDEDDDKAESMDYDDEEFEIQMVLDHRLVSGKLQYKVRWAGFGPQDDSWVAATDLSEADDLIHTYEALVDSFTRYADSE